MIKLQILKKTTFLIISMFMYISLNAKEPFLAILLNVTSNGTQNFNYGNYDFYCEQYGTITIEDIYNKAASKSICRKKIEAFYKKNPDLKYFSSQILYKQQRYHIEFKNQKCVLYVKGQVSLSELLLKEGLAVQKPNFKDEEFEYDFYKSQQKAKNLKKGLWKDKIYENCIQTIDKF